MDTNRIILIFYLLPMVICTAFTMRNIIRLLNTGAQIRATKIYRAFFVGTIPLVNTLVAWRYCTLAICDALFYLNERLEKHKTKEEENDN